MQSLFKPVFDLPADIPPVTTGLMLKDEKTLITGHINGYVISWDINDHSFRIIANYRTSVKALSYNEDNDELLIGYYSGALYLASLFGNKSLKMIRAPLNSKFSRVWRTAWSTNNAFLVSSTYGTLTPFSQANGEWTEQRSSLKGHNDSIFALDAIKGKFAVSADWRGIIQIWKIQEGQYKNIQKLFVSGSVEDIRWQNEERFAAVTEYGKMYVVEKKHDQETWEIVSEVYVAHSTGKCIDITQNGKYVFAATNFELIQFDLELYQSASFDMPNVKALLSLNKKTYALCNKGLFQIDIKPVEVKDELIAYKFSKISLMGITGTGKSTFCEQLVNGTIENVFSTFGKKIFTYNVKRDEDIDTRIFFHDHGGQEAVLDTFISQVSDSDIILIFYKKTSKYTFVKAIEILKQIKEKVGFQKPVYFIETFMDHELDDIPVGAAEKLLQDGLISGLVPMSLTKNSGFDDFKAQILDKIDWEHARKMFQSPYAQGISTTLSIYNNSQCSLVPFDLFKEKYQEIIGKNIPESHLKFLLEDYSNQGIIEFYPDILRAIILDDTEFNKMRTEIPRYANDHNGLIHLKDLMVLTENKPESKKFIEIFDEMYSRSGFAIRNGSLRIFPQWLPETLPEDIPATYKQGLPNEEPFEVFLKFQEIDSGKLISILSDLGLQCISLSKKEGLFAWEERAFVYYYTEEARRGVFDKYIKFSYLIGGNDESTKERLQREFYETVNSAYGPIVEVPQLNTKKKANLSDTDEFDVIVTYAKKQKDYASSVGDILRQNGVKVLEEEFNETSLWGKTYTDYLGRFYNSAKFCIVLLSDEYIQTISTKSSIQNEKLLETINQFSDEKFVAIVFDGNSKDILKSSRNSFDSQEFSPSKVANACLDKLKEIHGLEKKKAVNEICPPITLKKLTINNIKCIQNIELTFKENPESSLWKLIVGDNAVGKTTILQCIALCSLGPEIANKLDLPSQNFLRNGAASGFVEAIFEVQVNEKTLEIPIRLLFNRKSRTIEYESNKQLTEFMKIRNDTKFKGWFVVGYGASRNLTLTDEPYNLTQEDLFIERVKSLFDPNKILVDPASLYRLLSGDLSPFKEMGAPTTKLKASMVNYLRTLISKLLPSLSCTDSINDGLMQTPYGEVPIPNLSDGFRSMLSWLSHFITHLLMTADWDGEINKLSGIILIDEIDLHLHPKWQLTVIDSLRKSFPNMQFIVTSHSPMTVGSLSTERKEIILLETEKDQVVKHDDFPSIKGWRADQILTGPLFGLSSTQDLETQELINKYNNLATKDGELSAEEERDLASIADLLDERIPSSAEKQEAREAFKIIQQSFDERWNARSTEEKTKIAQEILLLLQKRNMNLEPT